MTIRYARGMMRQVVLTTTRIINTSLKLKFFETLILLQHLKPMKNAFNAKKIADTTTITGPFPLAVSIVVGVVVVVDMAS
jgi:hypothetical protein